MKRQGSQSSLSNTNKQSRTYEELPQSLAPKPSQSYSLTKQGDSESDPNVMVCRKCPNKLTALFWTLDARTSHSLSVPVKMLPFEESAVWRSRDFIVSFGKRQASLQLVMQRNVSDGELDMQLCVTGVGDKPGVNTQKYKYALELHIAGVTHRSAEYMMVECNESIGTGTVKCEVLHVENVPEFESAAVTVNIAKTNMYCTPCAKAVDFFSGGHGRTLHRIVTPKPTVPNTDSISTLPNELISKILSYVGNDVRSFGSIAGVCKQWWNLAYYDNQQYFSEKILVFNSLSSPMRLATLLAVCQYQVREIWLDFYEMFPMTTFVCDSKNLQTVKENKKKLKYLAMADLPKLRKYRLRVFTKCNEHEQHKHVIDFFDKCIPTLREVVLKLDWIENNGIKKEELMAAVRKSVNLVEFELNDCKIPL